MGETPGQTPMSPKGKRLWLWEEIISREKITQSPKIYGGYVNYYLNVRMLEVNGGSVTSYSRTIGTQMSYTEQGIPEMW